MSLRNEIGMHNKAETSKDSGEIELWDKVIFPNIIRKRELEVIFKVISAVKPERILDLGCGGGWLSKILSSKGFQVTGIDISSGLVKVAKKVSPDNAGFIVGDCMNLCLKNNTFDLIICMGVLHHLDLDKTLLECHRLLNKSGSILLMEPNALNPLMAIGRKLAPMGTCTEDEQPIVLGALRNGMTRNGLKINKIEYIIPYCFCASYVSGKIKSQTYQRFIKMMLPLIEISEKVIEKIPLVRNMSSVVIVVGEK